MGPVKPGLMVRTITLKFYLNLHENETSVFILGSSSVATRSSSGRVLRLSFGGTSRDLTTGGTGHRSGDWSSFPRSPGESTGSVKDTVFRG